MRFTTDRTQLLVEALRLRGAMVAPSPGVGTAVVMGNVRVTEASDCYAVDRLDEGGVYRPVCEVRSLDEVAAVIVPRITI